jgi:hypothetical protein
VSSPGGAVVPASIGPWWSGICGFALSWTPGGDDTPRFGINLRQSGMLVN